MTIEWTSIRLENVDESFEYNGMTFKMEEFRHARNKFWGDMPNAEYWEAQGVTAWLARGAGNADTYMFVLDMTEYYSEDKIRIALVDNADAEQEQAK